jgi:hypothetical protein
VVVVVTMVSLLGMAALVLDLGYGFVVKRQAQAAADASALAAVQALPDTAAAGTASASYASRNFSGDTRQVTITYSSRFSTDDTANTHATATAPSFFGKLLGFSSYAAGATASATVGSYTGWANNVSPWTVDRPHAHNDFGSTITFKVASGNDKFTPGNFGAVQLPIRELGCALGNGTTNYRDLIIRNSHSCLVQVGDTLQSETGDLGANTGNALHDRGAVTGFDPYSVLQLRSDGSYEITDYNNANVILIPIVDNFSNGATTFHVTTLAWFIITNYAQKEVTGMFVRSQAQSGALCPTASNPNNPCPIGARDPDGTTVVLLSG